MECESVGSSEETFRGNQFEWPLTLFFDEVIVKEGFVFDTPSWELIGFTDFDTDEDNLNAFLKRDGSEHSSLFCKF